MIALVTALVLAAAPHYPLATVFVRDGELWLSELGQEKEKRLGSPGLTADAAALDVTRTKVAFTARRLGETQRLFLMDLGSGGIEELSTGLVGPHHAPTFSGDGKRLFFTAAPSVNPGPEQPTKVRVWNIGAKKLEALPATGTNPNLVCEFHPAPRKTDVLHVSTDCLGSFSLSASPISAASAKSPGTWVPRKLSGPEIEIAASFDGSRFVYTVTVRRWAS